MAPQPPGARVPRDAVTYAAAHAAWITAEGQICERVGSGDGGRDPFRVTPITLPPPSPARTPA